MDTGHFGREPLGFVRDSALRLKFKLSINIMLNSGHAFSFQCTDRPDGRDNVERIKFGVYIEEVHFFPQS